VKASQQSARPLHAKRAQLVSQCESSDCEGL
jgi:hypothetical protein